MVKMAEIEPARFLILIEKKDSGHVLAGLTRMGVARITIQTTAKSLQWELARVLRCRRPKKRLKKLRKTRLVQNQHTTFNAVVQARPAKGRYLMDKEQQIKLAQSALERGDHVSAHSLLQDLAERGDPEALYLCATFSYPRTETDEEFEARSMRLLARAAELDFPPAQYSLGVCYDLGDLVKADSNRAGILFEKAAAAGYPKAKFCHGRNLFYGSNGFDKDVEAGLALISAAAIEGVDDAAEFLCQLKEG